MEINQSIFKSYDIRGICPKELDEETAYNIGRAFVKRTGAKRIAVGRDARMFSEELFNSLSAGLFSAGAEIFDIGQVPTECLYFAVGFYDFDAGVMITASHNPKEYNGFKMIKKNNKEIEMVRGKDLLASMEPVEFKKGSEIKIEKKDIFKDFTTHILSFADLSQIMPLKVVVDASNGVAGSVLSKIQDVLPVEIVALNFTPDGNFPNHSPNPLLEGSADQISNAVKREKADFGMIFDGDGDRIFLVDENGEMVKADVVLLMMAKYLLEKNPGMAIAYNAICSKAVPEFVKKWGSVPIKTAVGFVNVREGLLRNNGIMGGELSGHYCFKDNFYMDSGLVAFLTLLLVVSKENKKVSEMAHDLSPYAKSSEINFEIQDKSAVLNKIKEKYSDGRQDYLDGVTVEYSNWWFNIRPSNTEPLLRLTIEADTQDILEQKKKELTAAVAGS